MTTPRDTLLAWLRDAYAMEQAMERMLTSQARAAAKFQPRVAKRLREHAEETKRQAELVRECIENNGGRISTLKSLLGLSSSAIQSLTNAFAPDDVVKNGLAGYAAEHFEIACYRALVAAATAIGDRETARVCEEILAEEERMAAFLEKNLPNVVKGYLEAKAA